MSKSKEKVSKYGYPSRYGSDKSMIVKGPDEDGFVVCEDEFGMYTTRMENVGTGLVDPNRCAQSRLGKLFGGKKEKS